MGNTTLYEIICLDAQKPVKYEANRIEDDVVDNPHYWTPGGEYDDGVPLGWNGWTPSEIGPTQSDLERGVVIEERYRKDITDERQPLHQKIPPYNPEPPNEREEQPDTGIVDVDTVIYQML
ncbi:hypothetical protein COV16_00905 [Candidatus Woesearchaeota archaeon CG10_big_fil_rev_8_21_14_0_10_34_8]|nr:MAG: hypothetical protein COV16_00905 [Candidatus Woesearchaeota archaeon CG10_big_fil_rev_8_21_14_0_10_34_8]